MLVSRAEGPRAGPGDAPRHTGWLRGARRDPLGWSGGHAGRSWGARGWSWGSTGVVLGTRWGPWGAAQPSLFPRCWSPARPRVPPAEPPPGSAGAAAGDPSCRAACCPSGEGGRAPSRTFRPRRCWRSRGPPCCPAAGAAAPRMERPAALTALGTGPCRRTPLPPPFALIPVGPKTLSPFPGLAAPPCPSLQRVMCWGGPPRNGALGVIRNTNFFASLFPGQ